MDNSFKSIFKGKVVIVGVGNTLRQDDGVGPAFIEKIKGRVEAVCLDAGMAPENHLAKIIREEPDTILIVDALYLGLAPGEYSIVNKDEILKSGLSTHDASCQMLIEYLKKNTGADIYVLGIQPAGLSLGEAISPSVQQALEALTDKTVSQLNPESRSSRRVSSGK